MATMPRLANRRPIHYRFGTPRRYARRLPPTVLERRRRLEYLRRGGPPPHVLAVQRGARRMADAIRSGLLALRRGLLAVQRRFSSAARRRARYGGY